MRPSPPQPRRGWAHSPGCSSRALGCSDPPTEPPQSYRHSLSTYTQGWTQGHTHMHSMSCSLLPGLSYSPAQLGRLACLWLCQPSPRTGLRALRQGTLRRSAVRSRLSHGPLGELTSGDLPSHHGCRLFSPKPCFHFLCLRHVYFLQTQHAGETSDGLPAQKPRHRHTHHDGPCHSRPAQHWLTSEQPCLQVPLWVLRWSRAKSGSGHIHPSARCYARDEGPWVWGVKMARG